MLARSSRSPHPTKSKPKATAVAENDDLDGSPGGGARADPGLDRHEPHDEAGGHTEHQSAPDRDR